MKKKHLTKSNRDTARLVANLDGKYKGITQEDVELAVSLLTDLEAAIIRQGKYRSLVLRIRKSAVKKAGKR